MIKKLYIIGNGFDRYHGVKSDYAQFHKWVKTHSHWPYDKFEEYFTVPNEKLWSALEENMGGFACGRYGRDTTSVKPSSSDAGCTDHVLHLLGKEEMSICNWRKAMQEALAKWVDTLGCKRSIAHLPIIDDDAFYLTFNYTLMLEDEYKIDPRQILHIHGKKGDESHSLVLGHGGIKDEKGEKKTPLPKNETLDAVDLAEGMARDAVHKWKKPVCKLIDLHEELWDKLSDVQAIDVLGFSFGVVDLPYIKKIADVVPPGVIWRYSWFGENELQRFRHALNSVGVGNPVAIRLDELCGKKVG